MGIRERLPKKRRSERTKYKIGGITVHIDVGFYPDGRPGEFFLDMSKTGSAVKMFGHAFAKAVSIAIQYGAPIEVLKASIEKLAGGPDGPVESPSDGGPQIEEASSIPALVVRVLDWYAKNPI